MQSRREFEPEDVGIDYDSDFSVVRPRAHHNFQRTKNSGQFSHSRLRDVPTVSLPHVSMSSTSTILLRPRPYARHAGAFLLVALLPPPKRLPELPVELWTAIFGWVTELRDLWGLMRACKAFKDMVCPLVYSRIKLSKLTAFTQFATRLELADQNWSPLHRFPYSSPGRWVQALDLSAVEYVGQAQALMLDSLLVGLFPLVPFLSRLSMNPSFVLSRRVMESLGRNICASSLKVLEGISYSPAPDNGEEEPLTNLLRSCLNIEELEVIGVGLDPAELIDPVQAISAPEPFFPLHLPRLRTLTILSVCSSHLLFVLVNSPLPALQKLTLTPYEDVPNTLSTPFIESHGTNLRSLLLFTPKSWPTRLHTSPSISTLMSLAPKLTHLSLERPLPSYISLPNAAAIPFPLQILSVPRPDPDFWPILERTLLPQFPYLRAIRARDVRWLRKGMGASAQSTGVQGEMMEWRRRLLRRGIKMLDGEWREYEA
ncbi:F-box domain-containing protein [Mycena indigotica]|uniref:F-box domain-containing protein n=1 Tax=Mycena indigotica TaxID=2126181 RepID=A0A8H6SZ53_9AGAR|nr:F-box domain-containing protein [Mycena indigotica]KAF7307447.1 F-box domain-containing protein [Mycena indigotica]